MQSENSGLKYNRCIGISTQFFPLGVFIQKNRFQNPWLLASAMVKSKRQFTILKIFIEEEVTTFGVGRV